MMSMLLHAVYCPRCFKPMIVIVRDEGGRCILMCPYCEHCFEYEYYIRYRLKENGGRRGDEW